MCAENRPFFRRQWEKLGFLAVSVFRVRVYTLINTVNRAVTTVPLDKVNNHFSDRIIINYDF
jgi:hypothetical protein